MTVNCVAVGCKNVGSHLFPKDANKRKLWEEAMTRKNCKSGPYSRLCSAHFRSNDYSLLSEYSGSKFMRKVLRRTAVPSVFSLTNDDTSDQHLQTALEHLESRKPNVTPSLGTETNGERSICEICNKQYDNAHILNEHMKYVHKPPKTCFKNYADYCQTCLRRFPIESDLKSHLVKMRFACKDCRKCFGSEKELSTHELIHQTVAQYSCHLCGERFEENFALTSHMHKHSVVKSYSRKKAKLTVTGNKLTDHSKVTGQNITGSEVTKLTGKVSMIKDSSKHIGQAVKEETAVKTTIKMEQDVDPQKIWIEVDVKGEPDESLDEQLDWLQCDVKTELNMSLECQESVNIKEEAEDVKTESMLHMISEHQVKQESEGTTV